MEVNETLTYITGLEIDYNMTYLDGLDISDNMSYVNGLEIIDNMTYIIGVEINDNMTDLGANFRGIYRKMAEKVVSHMAIGGVCLYGIFVFLCVWMLYLDYLNPHKEIPESKLVRDSGKGRDPLNEHADCGVPGVTYGLSFDMAIC